MLEGDAVDVVDFDGPIVFVWETVAVVDADEDDVWVGEVDDDDDNEPEEDTEGVSECSSDSVEIGVPVLKGVVEPVYVLYGLVDTDDEAALLFVPVVLELNVLEVEHVLLTAHAEVNATSSLSPCCIKGYLLAWSISLE